MNCHYLSIEERNGIRKYDVDGLRYRQIAKPIGRSLGTTSREIQQNCTHIECIPAYDPHIAQKST